MVVVGFSIVVITSRHALLRRYASRSWLVFASKHRHGSSRIGRCVYRGGQSLRQSWGRYCGSLVGWIICLTVQNCLGEACLDLHFVSPVPYAPCSMFDNVNFFRRSMCFLSVALSGARFRCCPLRIELIGYEQFATAPLRKNVGIRHVRYTHWIRWILWILWENDDFCDFGGYQNNP